MKVICINDNWIIQDKCIGKPSPKFGDIDIVIYEGWNKISFYELERFPGYCFAQNNFIPLSTIDETEIHSKTETAPELIK